MLPVVALPVEDVAAGRAEDEVAGPAAAPEPGLGPEEHETSTMARAVAATVAARPNPPDRIPLMAPP